MDELTRARAKVKSAVLASLGVHLAIVAGLVVLASRYGIPERIAGFPLVAVCLGAMALLFLTLFAILASKGQPGSIGLLFASAGAALVMLGSLRGPTSIWASSAGLVCFATGFIVLLRQRRRRLAAPK